MSDVQSIRKAIVDALPISNANHGELPELRELYVPPAHIKALRLECNLVVGARGVGKSFWTAALSSPQLRAALGQSVADLEKTDVRIGFTVAPNIDDFPNEDVFASLKAIELSPYDLWRAVIARWSAKTIGENIPTQDWPSTTAWVKEKPEPLARLMQRANNLFLEGGGFGLIVFDALDRTSKQWQAMDDILRDLLRAVLWLKSFSRLHAKVFLREDQLDRTITDFPDASKLLATKAELTWAAHDLHGLLWQVLCNTNGESGITLRVLYQKTMGDLPLESNAIWRIHDKVKREGEGQRILFGALAGPWMGKDRRRGVPYTWSVGHLADGRGRTSPRSFLAAIRAAAEDSMERYPDHPYALHYESIKRGVQNASQIRVDEMAEDYPWVPKFMDPLRGLSVPCEYELIEKKWVDEYPDGPRNQIFDRLPPQHVDRGWPGVSNDFEKIGIFEQMKDARINLPDLYRVGFGLGRRGGVKPIK